MTLTIEVTRPDDLLRLRIELRNLRLDRPEGDLSALVVDNAALPAFLSVVFPPQAIAERAYFEASIVAPDIPPGQAPPPPTPIQTPGLPGQVPARMAHPSRLVFKVPAGARNPFTTEGLLDWSGLELSVSAIAAIPADPTPAQIAQAPAIAPPADTETALELPYRLVVSPTAAVRWAHRTTPFTSRGRTELWHTRLQLPTTDGVAELSQAAPASLRAIWSDDYSAVKMPDRSAEDPQLGLSAMSPSDRHQIVVLTSAFHGYEGQITIDLGGFGAGGGIVGPISGATLKTIPLQFTVPYVPQPFFADQLMLSSLGGWLRSRGHWIPPARARRRFRFDKLDIADIVTRIGPILRPEGAAADRLVAQIPPGLSVLLPQPEDEQLDLSEWAHIATQGRDHYVRIVYEGELLPFRNRAALVKVTERKFREQNGVVVAHMFQRMFIVVREPEKFFAASDRGMPFRRVRLTTLVTPDIAPPVYVNKPEGRSFWVEVMTSATDRAPFKFHAVGTGADGQHVDFTIPLMFVSIADIGETRQRAIRAYNESSSKALLEKRAALVPGQKLRLAERDANAVTDNTQLVTRALNFVMAAGGTAPALLKADVNIPQVQELLGTNAPTSIRFFKTYVDQGIETANGVFAEVIREDFSKFLPDDPFAGLVPETLGVNFTSDQAGGFATPNLGVSTLSRALGPLAGKAEDAVAGAFDPKTFFKKGMAKLFGSFDLFDLVLPGAMAANAPKLQTETHDIPGGKLLVATIDWEPAVHSLDLIVAAFEKDHGGVTALKVHGRIEKPLTFDAAGAPAGGGVSSVFNGTLNDFQIVVLKAVAINFREFGFVARSGAKTDVRVALDPVTPLQFSGDLEFVEELRKIIPPDLFGDGPSLDISASGIRAGFSFALPPVAVGVFALKDISLGAALTLPFADGRPTFDFNVSERPHPFLLSIGIFGGGGFFRLQLDTAGIKIVEAAFEFGATLSIDLGVASGGVFVMAGIYFKLERKEPSNELAPTLTGYLRMGGYLSVLGLIKVSLEFNLSFTYDGLTEKAYGRATLTVKVEIVFFSTSVEVTVEKAFGGKSGDPAFGELFAAPDAWSEYALAFA